MPLSKPLPALRQDLRDLLTEDLAAALTALKELLPENGDKHGQILALQARLKDANKERLRNTLSPDDYQRRVDTIRAECFDLLAELTEADFEEPPSGRLPGMPASRQGSVLYRVPRKMPMRKPTICTVRVAIDEDAIIEDIVMDDDVKFRPRVEVSDMMKAELIDPEGAVFTIRSLSEPEQLVRSEGYTQWLFSVTPGVEGEHQLLVKVSMLEFNTNLNKYVPREVSILETVTIVTEAAALADADEPPLKPSGERFALGPAESQKGLHVPTPPPQQAAPAPPSAPPSPIYMPSVIDLNQEDAEMAAPESPRPWDATQNWQKADASPPAVEQTPVESRPGRKGLRAAALFLAFLMLGTSATWALTPSQTRDWWLASVRDNADSYAGYIDKYQHDPANRYLETAYFRKANITETLTDLRAYQEKFRGGQYEKKVLEKINTLENKAIERIRQQPETGQILRYLQDFPDSERFSEIKQVAETRAELRAEVLPALENAYVRSLQTQPTAQKVMAYLRDFPRGERLAEVTQAAAARPEVLGEVQPAIEQALLEKARAATSAAEVQDLLPALESMGSSTAVTKVQEIVAQKPKIRQEMLPQLKQAAERVRLLRTERSARGDTDGDGVLDQEDRCPNEKGEAANQGCPGSSNR